MAFTRPPLPYDFSALEPHIDAKTMEIHHGKHHQTYVNNLNAAIEKAHRIAALGFGAIHGQIGLLQDIVRAAARGIEQRARPGKAGEALPAGGRDDGERRPVDPAVRAPEPARLEVGRHGNEEQPVERRLLVEHGGVGLEVALPGAE